MIRCLTECCKHNDDGSCDEHEFINPILSYTDGCWVLSACDKYAEREPEEEETCTNS